MISRLLVTAIVLYVAALLFVFLYQRKLLYIPDTQPISPSQASSYGLRHWPSEDNFRGFISKASVVNTSGKIVVFHGNAGSAKHRERYIDALAPRGFQVILAEYPGYGGRAGSPNEAILVADGIETLKQVDRDFDGLLYLWGESLGAGVAASIASASPIEISGIVMFSAWDSFANVAQAHYRYLPARWLVKDKYDSLQNLRSYKGKVAVLIADNDGVVEPKFSKNLYDGISTSKRLWRFPAAGHNTIPTSPDLAWWQEVTDFLSGDTVEISR